MTTKNSFNIFVSNFRIVYRMLIFTIIILAILGAIAYAVYNTQIKDITADIKAIGIQDDIKEYVKDYLDISQVSETESAQRLEADFQQFKSIISDSLLKVNWMSVMFFGSLLLLSFILNNVLFCAADLIDKFMHSKMKYNLFTSFVDNIRSSLLYSLLSTLIIVPIESLAVYFLLWAGLKLINTGVIFSLGFAFLIFVTLIAVINVFKAYWLPAVIHGKDNVVVGLRKAVTKGVSHFPEYIGVFWISIFLLFSLSALLFVASLGTAIVIIIPSYYLFLLIQGFTLYYKDNKLSYYCSECEIVRAMETKY